MSSTGETATQTMERLRSPIGDYLSPEVAERIAALSMEPDVQARIDYLAE